MKLQAAIGYIETALCSDAAGGDLPTNGDAAGKCEWPHCRCLEAKRCPDVAQSEREPGNG